MKYKVGDKVRVREDLDIGIPYHEYDEEFCTFSNDDMKQYAGKRVTISESKEHYYRLSEDNGAWYWTDEMFEGKADNFTYRDLETGMFGRMNDGEIFVVVRDKLILQGGDFVPISCRLFCQDVPRIAEVRTGIHCFNSYEEGTVVYPAAKHMTKEEIEKELGYKIEIVG